MTNYEYIKTLNEVQMSELLYAFTFYEEKEVPTPDIILNWLNAERE